MAGDQSSDDLLEMTVGIVGAYVSNNPVPTNVIPDLIGQVSRSLASLGKTLVQESESLKPHIPIKKTVTHDYLVSLEDGKKYKTLKRHLTRLGLTPDGYRAKWGLAGDYPMTAPSYSARRSEQAKKLGLGRKPAAKKPVAKRGRPNANR